jgi:hypothetical protein
MTDVRADSGFAGNAERHVCTRSIVRETNDGLGGAGRSASAPSAKPGGAIVTAAGAVDGDVWSPGGVGAVAGFAGGGGLSRGGASTEAAAES